jgi:transposase
LYASEVVEQDGSYRVGLEHTFVVAYSSYNKCSGKMARKTQDEVDAQAAELVLQGGGSIAPPEVVAQAVAVETEAAAVAFEQVERAEQEEDPDKPRTRFLSMQERKQATELLMAGHSVSSIAKVLDRSIPTISRVKKEVLKGKSWNEKRSKKRKSKFDNPDTINMITQHWQEAEGDLTYEKIAELLGCSTSTAWAFVKSQGWRRPNSKKGRSAPTTSIASS